MLTSTSNQYLRPEYLTPLPTTLDAKKSPLALLAQTCSQIGADSNNKPLIPPLEKTGKNSRSEAAREKASPASSTGSNSVCDVVSKSSFKPYESCTQRDNKAASPEERTTSSANRVRTPVSSKSSGNTPVPLTNGGRCHSNHSASSPRASPATVGRKTPASSNAQMSTPDASSKSNSGDTSMGTRTAHSPVTSSASKVGFSSSLLSSPIESALKDLPLGTFKPGAGLPVSTAGYLAGYPAPHFPMDVMASSLMSPHHQHLKPGLNPYIGYARMKTPSGVDTLVPVCRDPYCTGCQLSSHLLASAGAGGKSSSAGQCPGGCAQCDHATAAGKNNFLSGHHNPAAAAAAAAYAHAQLAALAAASQLPYVCSWIAADAAYCGKRFANSEELLQHLRTHTNPNSSESGSALSLLSPPGLPPTHPLFHRTYPTPPLSPLATARYHPYSKPPLLPPSLTASSLGFPLHPHPGIPPYFSPYSLYGQRLGAASGMHP